MKIIEGGVTAAQGFEAAGIEAAIKYQNRKDMAMVYSRTPAGRRAFHQQCGEGSAGFVG